MRRITIDAKIQAVNNHLVTLNEIYGLMTLLDQLLYAKSLTQV